MRIRNKNKRSPAGKQSLSIMRPVRAGFNYSTRTRLTYVTSVQLVISGSGAGVRAFTANGLYDPDITGVGHQPMGFDLFAGIYAKYIVRSSRCTIVALSPTDLTNGAPMAVGILLSNAPTLGVASVDALMEQGLNPYRVMCNASPLYRPVKLTSRVYRPELFFHVVNASDTQDELGALVTANPSTQAYFDVWFGQTPSGTDVDTLNTTVKLEYEVEFFDLREIGQS